MRKIFEKIEEWSLSILWIVMLGVSAFLFCVRSVDDGGHGTNYQECKLEKHMDSHHIAETYMQGARPFPTKEGGTHYIKVFSNEEESLKLFNTLAKEITSYHSKGNFSNKYGRKSERYFVCYGEEKSIIVSHTHQKHRDKDKYIVEVYYTDTTLFDWDYLSSRITN